MTITTRTKADVDAKNAACQLLSHYRTHLRTLGDQLSSYAEHVDQSEIIDVTPSFFAMVRRQCDDLNDVIDGVLGVFLNPALPPLDEQKRKIFPWYDSMNSWGHDSRAFIQNMYPIVRGYKGHIIHSGDMHSLIALQDALDLMARMLFCEVAGKPQRETFIVCELFKVFDKFKKCYRDDACAFWKRPDSGFHKSVRCVQGFEAVPLNLYANAFKYLPVNHSKANCIEVSFVEGKNGVDVIVSSVGPLVSEKDIPRLWETHFRAESAYLATDDGYGLGLPKVYNLCRDSHFVPTITSEHRDCDAEGWGLFTVKIHIPQDCYE